MSSSTPRRPGPFSGLSGRVWLRTGEIVIVCPDGTFAQPRTAVLRPSLQPDASRPACRERGGPSCRQQAQCRPPRNRRLPDGDPRGECLRPDRPAGKPRRRSFLPNGTIISAAGPVLDQILLERIASLTRLVAFGGGQTAALLGPMRRKPGRASLRSPSTTPARLGRWARRLYSIATSCSSPARRADCNIAPRAGSACANG